MTSDSTATVGRQGAAYNTLTHFILGPIFAINFVVAIYYAAHAPEHRLLHWWLVVIALAFFLLTLQQRIYSLRVQDRVIRLEESLRIARLAPAADLSALSTRQLIALRLAADGELPGLVERARREQLTSAQIKQAIITWRHDTERI